MTKPTRRCLVVGASAAGPTGTAAVAAASNPDAELIDICRQIDGWEKYYQEVCETFEDDDERKRLLVARDAEMPGLVDRFCELRAKTLAGFHARIRTILIEDLEVKPSEMLAESPFVNERLMATLLRDLAESAGIVA